jgi:hypothetical protein
MTPISLRVLHRDKKRTSVLPPSRAKKNYPLRLCEISNVPIMATARHALECQLKRLKTAQDVILKRIGIFYHTKDLNV